MKTSVGRNKFFWPREQGRGNMEQELAYLVLTRERQGRGSVTLWNYDLEEKHGENIKSYAVDRNTC